MQGQQLRQTVKQLICEALALEDVSPQEILDEAPLFGDGLGLDSIDALELAIEIDKRYKIRISENAEDRKAFASVAALAAFLHDRGVAATADVR